MTNTIQIQFFHTDFGELILGGFEDRLCLCDWQYRKKRTAVDERLQSGLKAVYEESDSGIIESAKRQLSEYFQGKRKVFDLPLLMVGTGFQKKVWNELLKIPFGKTETYRGLSLKMDNPLGIRAIASANAANALSIIVPCHRIIGSNGEMVGYAGGLGVKKKLLRLEGSLDTSQLELFDIV
jgi:methylated-DNA-[protein]-cysteine S-methyltransferase